MSLVTVKGTGTYLVHTQPTGAPGLVAYRAHLTFSGPAGLARVPRPPRGTRS